MSWMIGFFDTIMKLYDIASGVVKTLTILYNLFYEAFYVPIDSNQYTFRAHDFFALHSVLLNNGEQTVEPWLQTWFVRIHIWIVPQSSCTRRELSSLEMTRDSAAGSAA